ncbi:MAG: hypothetical protein F6K41_41845 [Symploca sp. SIO3E6]|nr:hypothetical protein [Caldora sp. SIO3E6]
MYCFKVSALIDKAEGRRQKAEGSPDEKFFSPPFMKIPLSASPRPRVPASLSSQKDMISV